MKKEKKEAFEAEIFDAFLENLRENFHSDLETFDSYKEKLKLQCMESLNKYNKRVAHGYSVIVNLIKEEIDKETKKK